MSEKMPSADFSFPDGKAPLPGYEAGSEYDPADYFAANAVATNEARGKLQQLLSFLSPFNENYVVMGNGERHLVLSQRLGKTSVATGSYHPWKVTVSSAIAPPVT